MNLLQQFQQFIQQENLFSTKDKLLLAVSGGVDSVALCELCQLAGYDFVMAHCNFQLRGAESERDEQFVQGLGIKYNKKVLIKRFTTEQYARDKRISIQVAARELRYGWFFEILGGESLDLSGASANSLPSSAIRLPAYLVSAHHLDDNIETMLMNFFKGTGIGGLRGMLPKQGKLIRPLLFAKKETIKQFAEENKLRWVEDSSNQSDKYSRNYFRNQVIPLVQHIYPGAENNLAGNLPRFSDIEVLYYQSINLHKKKLMEYKGVEVHIPVLKLKKSIPLASIVYEIIKDYQFSSMQVEEVIALLDSDTGKYIQSHTHRVIKNRNWIIIAPLKTSGTETIVIESTGTMEFGTWNLELREQPNTGLPIPVDSNIACLDRDEIQFPLILRKYKESDYFYPLGMKKKKKLSRFFIDLKLSKTDKEKVWLLEMNKKIIWVVGYRIDDRFKINPGTRQLLRVELKAADV